MWVGMVRDQRVRSSWTLYIQKARNGNALLVGDFSLSSGQGGGGVVGVQCALAEAGGVQLTSMALCSVRL